MMVTFISQCEKNAIKKTRRVLDAFANRIGDNVWQTVITEEGLKTVKKMLRQTASKSTAVSCHWIRSRSRSQFLWVVGNKSKFDENGYVPVNRTEKELAQFENNWHFLPLIKALVAITALFHDWGKATDLFQKKLKVRSNLGDPLRHEWISCLLFCAFVRSCDGDQEDSVWLQTLAKGKVNEKAILENVIQLDHNKFPQLPPVAELVVWLILAHHRLPLDSNSNGWKEEPAPDIHTILQYLSQIWGYENRQDEKDYQKRIDSCFKFSKGLMSQSKPWLKQLRKWALRLHTCTPLFEKSLREGSYRLVLHHARLCLTLGDHFYSSQREDKSWQDWTGLYANTDRTTKLYKQKLDEHLVGVAKNGLHAAHFLPRFEYDSPVVEGVASLKKNSPRKFDWQNKAVNKIKAWREQQGISRYGFFAVNMASTGCGKTFANAKIMRSLSVDGDSLRYVLALGLRTLTLQTGDEYRERIGMDSSELAVLIGSKAVTELHENRNQIGWESSESSKALLSEAIDYDCETPEEGLATVLKQQRDRQFLYSPVLACTVDHLMAATETRRGGRYILPSMRLMSSDLVIDEVDDFSGSDLIAMGRLIHLAGMLGRKVMISSATIPPDLAEGYFQAYHAGWLLYSKAHESSKKVGCAWIDEFTTHVSDTTHNGSLDAAVAYRDRHKQFIKKRIEKLERQPVKRRAVIVECRSIIDTCEFDSEATKQKFYVSKIQKAILGNHSTNHTEDTKTGVNVSFGVVRIANIAPCVSVSKILMESEWPDDIDMKIMSYHSQQTLLIRHEQEMHLDSVLKRKEQSGSQPKAFNDPLIRNHLDACKTKNMIFILIATPVEEVGRDHDFDWAVIEPSSYRSIVQLAGRVRRHRSEAVESTNISILQYNWKTIKTGDQPGKKYFNKPGYEEETILNTHDVSELIDPKVLTRGIDAIPRIQKIEPLDFRDSLVGLEHYVVKNQLTDYTGVGPEKLQGYLTGCWYLTALPQVIHQFRRSEPTTNVFLMYDPEEERCVFIEKDDQGSPVNRENILQIHRHEPSQIHKNRAWLVQDYVTLLEKYAEQQHCSMKAISLKYGELNFVFREGQDYEYSDQFGLVRI